MWRTKDQVAQEIIAEGRRQGITPRGIVIGISVGLVESNLTVYANAKVAGSLALPHDAVGSDGRSVGPLQQQVVMGGNGQWWWGPVEVCQDPTGSARLFFQRLTRRDYTRGDAGAHAQAIQQSAYPDRYQQRMAEAQRIYDRLAGATPSAPTQEAPPMGDPIWLPDVLRAAGLKCNVFPGAMERGHGDFAGIWGVVCHHTGSNGATAGSIANHPDLGLASQLHLGRDGTFTLCGVGIAWHAGQGAWAGISTNNANQVTIGIEAANDGGGTPGRPHRSSWPDAQYNAYVTGVAAILNKLGQPASHAIGHKEWAGAAQGKWDPGAIDMNIFRADVAREQARLRGAGTGGFLMALTDAQQKQMFDRVNYIYDQLGPGSDVWGEDGDLGRNAKGERLTLRAGLAALIRKVSK